MEGLCFELTFDGKSCNYKGPTEAKKGPITLIFINKSDVLSAVNLVRHTGDETIQDMVDYIGEEPDTKHHPNWTQEVGAWGTVPAGENHVWEGVLEEGIHSMVCASLEPLGVWFGAGVIVEE